MWANWIRSVRSLSTPRPRPARHSRLRLATLEDRTVPSAFRLGSTAPDTAEAVAADSAGNIYVVGSFNGTVDFDPGAGTFNLTSTGNADAFVAKYTSAGALVWAGQLVDTTAKAVAVDAAGAAYVTGSFFGTIDFDLGPGSSTLTSGLSSAAYMAKYNPDRSFAFARRLGGQTSGLSGDAITVDAAGNVYSSGVISNGFADMDPGAGTFTLTNGSGNANSYISKLDAAGNFVWAKQFVNDPTIAAGVWTAGIGVDSGQNVYLTGIFVGRADFGGGFVSTFDTTFPSGDGYVAKLTSAGNLAYVVRMGSATGREDGNGIAVDAAGNAFVTGQFSDLMTIDATAGDTTLTSAGNSDLFVMKLTTTGGLDWARRIGAAGFDGGLEIAYDGTDSIFLTGYYSNTVDFNPNAGVFNLTAVGGFTDVFALRLRTDSTFVNAWSFGGTDTEFGNDIAIVGTANAVVVGRFRGTADFDPGPDSQNLTSAGDDDAFAAVFALVANRPPVATDQSLATNEDTSLSGTVTATDADGDALTFAVVASPAHGTLTSFNSATGAFAYAPAANYNGPDSFTFKANDGKVDSNVATVSITVNAVNDAPVANNDAYSINEDTILSIAAPGVLGNDTDVEGSALTASVVTGPANGTLTLNANGSFSYRPKFDFNGTDSFTYKARDGSLDSNVATVTITVNPVNDAPRPTPIVQNLTTPEDTALSGQVRAVDPEGDPITFTLDHAPDHGTLVFNADGTFTYTPAANYFGPDAILYRASDPAGASNLGGVSITVIPVNDAPTAVNNAYSVNEDGSLDITAGPVTRLRMVSDAGDFVGQGLTYDFNPATATFTARRNFDNGASLSVDPPPLGEFWFLDFAAPDAVALTPGVYLNAMRFPFQDPGKPGLDVSGNGRGSNTLTGQFTVYDIGFTGTSSGDPLTRFAAAFEQHSEGNVPGLVGWVMFNSTFGAGGGVLANDTDVESDLLLGATLVTGPAHGALVWRGDGTFTYTPDADFNGTDSFTYRTNDGRADSNVATVTITVNPVNDAPVAHDGSAATDEDTPLSGNANATDVDGDPLTYSLVSGPAHGTLVLDSNGAFTYTPTPNYNGSDSFTFKANDGTVDSNMATFALTVRSVNDSPIASNASFTMDEDTALSGNVTATDADGDALTFSLVAGPSHGSVILSANGAFTYSPAANYNGADSFTFKANDGAADSNTATVSITVNPVNDAPVANDDSAVTDEDTAITIGVLGNDTDVDGDSLTVTAVTQPAHGTAAINADGTVTYTPAANYNGSDSFTYTVADGHGGTDTATVALTVRSVNDAPVASDASFTTDEDTALSGNVSATDADGDALTFSLVIGPAHGTVILSASGTFTYTPAANYNGPDTFKFKANDGTADSNTATVTITVNPVNDAPVAHDGAAATDEDTPLSGNANATDVDGDALNYSLVSGPSHGTLALNANGSFTYTPTANYNGSDSFTFKANDGTVDSNTAMFAITVRSVNDAPVANNASFTTDEDTALSGIVSATDADGDALTFSLVSGPAHGTVVLDSSGAFTYTPAANYNGADSFTFKANDGTADSNTATVSITVRPVNDAPVANNGSGATNEDTALSGNATATDVDGDSLTFSLVSGPSHGTLVLNNNGAFTYTPAANYNGADSFTFKANDGTVDSNTATFAITVRSVNDAPVASNASFTTNEDTALGGNVSATDADGDALTFSLVSGPSHGTVVLNSNGAFTYTPAVNYNGSDSFKFKANDGTLDSNTATVSITVNPVNDAPVANNGSAATNEDSALNGNATATDVDGDSLAYSLVTGPAHGTLVLNSNGAFTYTPAANYNGSDSFTFKANDGTVDSNTATFALTVRPVNDAPVAVNDSAATDEDTSVTVAALANDSDVDGNALGSVLVAGPAHGTALHNADGTFTYTPAANFNGTDSFTYKASDGSLTSNLATVTITIRPVNDAPVAANDDYQTNRSVPLNVPAAGVLANDTDVDGNALSAVLVSGPASGTLTLNANGSFTYTPNAGFTGTDTFRYRANDGAAASNVATVTVKVVEASDTVGSVTGGGQLDRGVRKFNMNVRSQLRKNKLVFTGNLTFRDSANCIELKSTSITAFHVNSDGVGAVFSGTAKVNGRAGYRFTVTVQDRGEPGKFRDTFRIQISGPGGYEYDSLDFASAAGLIDGGNIKVRRRA